MRTPALPMIAVVDDNVDRYSFLNKLEQQRRAQVLFFPDGRSALRVTSVLGPSFWLVNDRLSDMRGIDCIEMLVELHPDTRLFLIADQYSADDERSCFRFARVKYLCRPLDAQWLSRLLPSLSAAQGTALGAARSNERAGIADRSGPCPLKRDPSRAPPIQ